MGRHLDVARAAVDELATGRRSNRQPPFEANTKDQKGVCPLTDDVALRIDSREFGALWLVQTDVDRHLADPNEPTYTLNEAHRIIGLPHAMVRQIHEFKKTFGCRLERVERIDDLLNAREEHKEGE